MRLLAVLHRLGFHAALVAGLVLMPAMVLAGYWAEGGGRHPPAAAPMLRGSLDAFGG